MSTVFLPCQVHNFLYTRLKNCKADSLSTLYPAQTKLKSLETILPKSCFIAAITCEVVLEITQTRANHTASSQCPECKNLWTPTCLWQVHGQSPSWNHQDSLTNGDKILVGNHAGWYSNIYCHAPCVARALLAGRFLPLPIPHQQCSYLAIIFITDLPLSRYMKNILTTSQSL